jgi:pimeloyl-ACP methyl ester carboxylesterase
MKRKMAHIFLYLIGGISIIILALILALRVKSPGIAEPIADPDGNTISGSISVIEEIILGEQQQYLIIRGVDAEKPVMLFLHGGPGSPEFAFMKHYNQAIENDFVMVYWEQRGAGKSYSKHIPAETMNLEQLVSDTKELSEYLINRFQKEKIFIMGHSWGSFLGIVTAWRYPELYHAFFGVGQVAHQYRAEQISFDWVKEQAGKRKNNKAIKVLAAMDFPDSLASMEEWMDFLMRERKYVQAFGGGITREMKGMWPAVKIVLNTREYTLSDKLNYMKGSIFSLKNLWPAVIHTNLLHDIDTMQVPVYIFQGIYDYQTPYIVAKDFFDQLEAPEKDFFGFKTSAHSPLFEETEKFNAILRELKKTN